MALPKAAKNDVEDPRIRKAIDFATKLHDLLKERHDISNSQQRELEAHIKQILSISHSINKSHAPRLDAIGTDLWNSSAALLGPVRSEHTPSVFISDPVRVGVRIRIFALVLLNTAHVVSPLPATSRNRDIRIFKVALKATRVCLQCNDLGHAHTSLEICSQYVENDDSESLVLLSSAEPDGRSELAGTVKALIAEYYLFRLLHSWKSDRLDLAEHFYHKFSTCKSFLNADLTIKAADILYELAKSLSKDRKTGLTIKWYDRALTLLDGCEAESLNQDAFELLLSIGIALIDSLIATNEPPAQNQAWEVVGKLEKHPDFDNRIAMPLVKFRLLISEKSTNAEEISQNLFQLVKMVVLTEETFRLILQTIKKAVDFSPVSALAALKSFICVRVLPEVVFDLPHGSKAQSWLEKATISYILYATTTCGRSTDTLHEDLTSLLDEIQSHCEIKFTTKATHAAQTLLWKASGSCALQTVYAWIRLLRHTLFEHAGALNKTRIARKLMRTALDDGNTALARQAFKELPSASQNESLTRYLAFKIALRAKDEDLAMESLRVLIEGSGQDVTCLYACVLEAQQSESRPMAVATLQALLDERPKGIHLPSLLRCTARLLTTALDGHGQCADHVLLDVLPLFETAANSIDELSQASGDHWREEVQWWSKNSYNLAIRLAGSATPESLVRLLDVCMIFLDRYPNDLMLKQHERVEHRKKLCLFLATTALVVLGRCDRADQDEYTIRCYIDAQQRINVFKTLHEKSLGQPTDEHDQARNLAMLKFELECILRLEKWNTLGDALQACLDAPNSGRWDTLADLLILLHGQLDRTAKDAHGEMITRLLQRIINNTWKKDKDMSKVARWLRFTFALCLSHHHGDFSLKLLQQAAGMAEHGERGKHAVYPESELQWLAVTSFNHAIDLLVRKDEEASLLWMDGALALARWSADNGALHATLTGRKGIAQERIRAQQ